MIGEKEVDKIESYSVHATEHLTAATLRGIIHAIQKHYHKNKAEKEYAPGEKSMNELTKSSSKEQSGIECTAVTKQELHGFDQYAKKYGLRFSLVREKNDPSHYIFSYMQKDMSKLGHAMEDFLKDGQEHGDLAQKIQEAQKEAFKVNQSRAQENVKSKSHKREKSEPTL
ncbi:MULTISPECIES: DUF3801 domain-containing protein [Caproicibacterium]|uniref:DUF3801 domain-containing protein n=1 Tax=Caproicibacterium argilliputei TaxID=3030016 RepID=A0AA97DC74_9FIRM|nr:DUF3801 domain-containing protein [Caproicibacterium argilliputei]WOC32890.1 DUF3801 domain-containing protein [Caproicibacterium argilliputei]